jgi:hypothetical protein
VSLWINVLQIEGRGNGIKTNVVNCVDIAKALERPPDCESRQRLACNLAAPARPPTQGANAVVACSALTFAGLPWGCLGTCASSLYGTLKCSTSHPLLQGQQLSSCVLLLGEGGPPPVMRREGP